MEKMKIPATMDEQVSLAKELEISYRTLHPAVLLHDKQSDRTIKIPYASITNKYKHFLSQNITNIDLTKDDQEKYRFKPKLLSMDLYGTTELWNDLMHLNYVYSVMDFQPVKIRCYNPHTFKKLLNEVMIIEEGTIF